MTIWDESLSSMLFCHRMVKHSIYLIKGSFHFLIFIVPGASFLSLVIQINNVCWLSVKENTFYPFPIVLQNSCNLWLSIHLSISIYHKCYLFVDKVSFFISFLVLKLRSLSAPSEIAQNEDILRMFLMACNVKSVKLSVIGLSCLQKLISHAAVASSALKDILATLKDVSS